ncbi:hypothetical protein A2U01_0100054, partial [Trifolium medium]|nr:hypothetical protein [Trifolium medium]
FRRPASQEDQSHNVPCVTRQSFTQATIKRMETKSIKCCSPGLRSSDPEANQVRKSQAQESMVFAQ